ncbi:apolipoprotein E-like isoform X2 [Manacus candei]|nr:apolipoprotein E-like isoform X2 [Manacus candei]
MKLWVALVAAALLAGCGAELATPTPTAPPASDPPSRVWRVLGVLGAAAENATERLRESPLGQRLQQVVWEFRALRDEARDRAAEYGVEAKALLEQSWGDLRARGASFARKLRKRLSRDSEELRKRWEGGGRRPQGPLGDPRDPPGLRGSAPKSGCGA